MRKILLVIIAIVWSGYAEFAKALQPQQILIIANSDIPESQKIAQYYCARRNVPVKNILNLPLGKSLAEQISRNDYNKKIAAPVRYELTNNRIHNEIKCLLTLYGVPIKVASREPLSNATAQLKKLQPLIDKKLKDFRQNIKTLASLGQKQLLSAAPPEANEPFNSILKHLSADASAALKRIKYIEDAKARAAQYEQWIKTFAQLYGQIAAAKKAEKNTDIKFSISRLQKKLLNRNLLVIKLSNERQWTIDEKIKYDYYSSVESVKGLAGLLSQLNAEKDSINGKETYASVDSELSCVLLGDYDLYRWRRNELQNMPLWLPGKTLMVCRLDGPGSGVAGGLIDKSIKAETEGLTGRVYIDLRNATETGPFSYGYYDNSLKRTAAMFKQRSDMPVVVEKTSRLFQPGDCKQTAIYCGWYSLKKYIDAFDFAVGAVGFHIASFEAVDLRNPKSSNWCPAMLTDGITATLGAVNEPYLHSFPEPERFFEELLDGKCLVEAFYRTKPFNSWQLILIGDPLYKLIKTGKR